MQSAARWFTVAAVAVIAPACSEDQTNYSAAATGGASPVAGSGGAALGGAGTGGSRAGSGGAAGGGGSAGGARDGGTPIPDASASDGATSPDASGSGATASSIFKMCGFAPGGVCDGINAYATCIETACGSPLTQCFGPNNARDDFTGGVCATYATCVTTAPDSCKSGCTPSSDCQTCLGSLTTCVQASACTAPLCNGVSGTHADGGVLSDAGAPISGTCTDLEACCAAIADTASRDACNATLADARARAGDSDCAVVFSTYRSAGICK